MEDWCVSETGDERTQKQEEDSGRESGNFRSKGTQKHDARMIGGIITILLGVGVWILWAYLADKYIFIDKK